WLQQNGEKVLEIIGAIVSLATLITAITPSKKDDSVLAKIRVALSALGLLNPDKSFVGSNETKKEDK
ncbi:MAG: hypothetical protein MJ244_06570, partial [Clostridia bacterium]|nr:hypothetical protein [Clostridia bacterium]